MQEVYQTFLKQYHYETQIKKEKYGHCSKIMNCANNLEKQSKSGWTTSWKSGPLELFNT